MSAVKGDWGSLVTLPSGNKGLSWSVGAGDVLEVLEVSLEFSSSVFSPDCWQGGLVCFNPQCSGVIPELQIAVNCFLSTIPSWKAQG